MSSNSGLRWRCAMPARPARALGDYLNNHPLQNYLLPIAAVVLTLAIYLYPAVKTSAVTGLRALPPSTAPDLSLYLNISVMKTTAGGQLVDPYYGVTVPTARMGYSKFRLAFVLFAYLRHLLSGNLWWTQLIWNLIWWAVLCALAWWFFQEFLPEHSVEIIVLGLAILMFFNFGIARSCFAAWIHLPSLQGFREVEFPYIRPFFPQLPIPLLLLYLGVQIKALQQRSTWAWTALVSIQLVAFTIFPYDTLMMAGITAVALAGVWLERKQFPWATALLYGMACGVCDLLFFLHGAGVARTGSSGQYTLIHIQLSTLPHRIGGMWLLLAALTASVFFIRDLSPEVKWPLAGLGATNLLLMLGDAFFSETLLQVSVHAGYFIHFSASILLMFLVATAFRYLKRTNPRWRLVVVAMIGLLVLDGALVAQGTYLTSLPQNRESAALARAMQADPPHPDDLVVARAVVVDDDCAWVPLITDSHVLFCRNAQVLLSPEQNSDIHRLRQALYLYFTGRDSDWVDHVIQDPGAQNDLLRLMFLGQATSDPSDRAVGIKELRTDLIPRLVSVQQKDSEIRAFFSPYKRVFVVDSFAHPTFVLPRLSSFLQIEQQTRTGDLLLLRCKPLAQ